MIVYKFVATKCNRFTISVLLVLTLNLAFIGLATAQEVTASWNVSTDDMEKLGLEILIVFLSLHDGTALDVVGAELSKADKDIVENAVFWRPYSIDAIDVLQDGCDYYYLTESEVLEIGRLVAYLAGSHRVEIEGQLAYFEQMYRSLSVDGKGWFHHVENGIEYSTYVHDEKRDFLESVNSLGRDHILSRYSDFCPRLSERRSRIELRELIVVEEYVSLERKNND